MFVYFAVFFLLLISSLILLWSGKILDMISILLNYWDLFCGLVCDLSWRMFHVQLKRMCILLGWDVSWTFLCPDLWTSKGGHLVFCELEFYCVIFLGFSSLHQKCCVWFPQRPPDKPTFVTEGMLRLGLRRWSARGRGVKLKVRAERGWWEDGEAGERKVKMMPWLGIFPGHKVWTSWESRGQVTTSGQCSFFVFFLKTSLL